VIDRLFLKFNRFVPERWKWVLEHSGFKKYFANTGWMFLGQMFSLVVSFFIGAWLARYLGPENYGIVSYAVAFVGLFNFIAYLGIHSILLRDLARYPEKRDELLGTSFYLLLLSSCVAFILVAISVFSFESSAFVRSLIILYSICFLWSAFGVINIFFQSTVQAKKNVSVGIISGIVASILKVILIVSGKGIIWLMLIFVFETLLNSSLYVINYKKSGLKFSAWRFDAKLAKDILSGAWLLALAAAASFILVRVDQVMIRNYLGEVSVGLYAAAIKLVEIWYFIPGIICASLLPAIINAKKISEEKYLGRLNKLYILLGGIAVAIAIPLTILAPRIINFLFGSAYIGAVDILRIYVWSGIGVFLNVGLYQYFLSENRLKLIFYFYIFLMILNIVLNLILIPKLGLTGAAWATLISYSAGVAVVFGGKKLFSKKTD
jgi:O-antigen/teichoic acid export membrane protein